MEEKIIRLVLDIWAEQARQGICPPDEVDPDLIEEWIANRTYPASKMEAAADGDVAAIALIRAEAGLLPLV